MRGLRLRVLGNFHVRPMLFPSKCVNFSQPESGDYYIHFTTMLFFSSLKSSPVGIGLFCHDRAVASQDCCITDIIPVCTTNTIIYLSSLKIKTHRPVVYSNLQGFLLKRWTSNGKVEEDSAALLTVGK